MEHTLKYVDGKLFVEVNGKRAEIYLGPSIAKDFAEVMRRRIQYAIQDLAKAA